MSQVNVLILRAAGTNCDLETQHAWELAGARPERIHVRRLIEQPGLLDRVQVLTIPGGFSYGDDIAAGKILAVQLERHLGDALRAFIGSGRLVLGVCNGFQVLVKAGLLPDSHQRGREPTCTVTYNEPPGFQDRWVAIRARDSPCVFTEPGRAYELPIAHGEGRVLFADAGALQEVQRQHQDALVYVPSPSLSAGMAMPANPNGSDGDIAGLCDPTGRVLGLMPHPERFVTWTQHPCWTSLPPREPGDGLAIFQRAVAYFA